MHAADALPFFLFALGDLVALIWIRQWRRRQKLTKRMIASLSAGIRQEMAVNTGRRLARQTG